MKILLITPPMIQINTPYPATAYLTAFLRSRGIEAVQADFAIELLDRLFTPEGIEKIFKEVQKNPASHSHVSVRHFIACHRRIAEVVGPVLKFLRGQDPTIALRIHAGDWLPEGPRFESFQTDEVRWNAFGSLGVQDQAQHLGSLFLDDLADAIREGVDARFEFARYGERLAASQLSFDPLLSSLQERWTLIDEFLEHVTQEFIQRHAPDLVAVSVPFSGTVAAAFRIAGTVKKKFPKIARVLGGGYVSTELRSLSDPRVFDWWDWIVYDDGELPLLRLCEFLEKKTDSSHWVRTAYLKKGQVILPRFSGLDSASVSFSDIPAPVWDGLPLNRYVPMFEMLNPVNRLWTGYRWNKMILAHGCYWKKCTFCDTTLEYIGRYEPQKAARLVDQIEKIMGETGITGFHFVDEAAPPALLKAMAEEILRRRLAITWWGNIRFEKTFDARLTQLLAQSGCVAVTGGLEVASERLLQMIHKGVSIEQVARVTRAFSNAGVLVHAYLMYGFPTQSVQETVDSLEVVRQLFVQGCIQSGFWHRFACTVHSPIGKNPERYGIRLLPFEERQFPHGIFSVNDLAFEDPTGVDHDSLGEGLRVALYNYMHGVGLDQDVRSWFSGMRIRPKIPKSGHPQNLIARALRDHTGGNGKKT